MSQEPEFVVVRDEIIEEYDYLPPGTQGIMETIGIHYKENDLICHLCCITLHGMGILGHKAELNHSDILHALIYPCRFLMDGEFKLCLWVTDDKLSDFFGFQTIYDPHTKESYLIKELGNMEQAIKELHKLDNRGLNIKG